MQSYFTGNTHSVKLMETASGETLVIDEASQQILAQIGGPSNSQSNMDASSIIEATTPLSVTQVTFMLKLFY